MASPDIRALYLVFVSGPIASGKTTLAETIARERFSNGYYPIHLEVSTYIKQLVKADSSAQELTRDVLQSTKGLGVRAAELIIDRILQERIPITDGIAKSTPLCAIISGAREREVVETVEKALENKAQDIAHIWVTATPDSLYKRWMKRQGFSTEDDTLQDRFEQMLKRDEDLGLAELRRYFQSNFR